MCTCIYMQLGMCTCIYMQLGMCTCIYMHRVLLLSLLSLAILSFTGFLSFFRLPYSFYASCTYVSGMLKTTSLIPRLFPPPPPPPPLIFRGFKGRHVLTRGGEPGDEAKKLPGDYNNTCMSYKKDVLPCIQKITPCGRLCGRLCLRISRTHFTANFFVTTTV